MSWRRWNWLDDGLLPLAVAILRTCWIWLWLAWLQRWLLPSRESALFSVGLVFAVLLAGTFVARRALRLPSLRARMAVAALGFALILAVLWWLLYRGDYALWNLRWVLTWATDMVTWTGWETEGIPMAVFGFFALAFLWLRGLLDGGRILIVRGHIWGVFASGFIALALALLLAQVDAGGVPPGASNVLWLYFGTGMVALAITGLKDAGGLQADPGESGEAVEARPQFDRYWVGSVVSVMGGLLLLALAISTLVAPEAVSQVLRAVWFVVRQGIIYLWFAVSLLLLPIAYVLALIFAPLVDRLAGIQLQFQRDLQETFNPEQLQGAEGGSNIVESLPDELRWVALAVLLIVVALAFALALRRLLTTTPKDDIDETRESVLSRDLLQLQLSELWKSVLSRLDRDSEEAIDPFLSLDGETPTRRTIRAIYQALLASAQDRGVWRHRSSTPAEFRKELERLWPENGDQLTVITDGYVPARYAAKPPTAEQADRIQRAWERLESASSTVTDEEADGE